MSSSIHPITQQLLAFKNQMDMRELFPSLEPGATDFALENTYAFCVATCMDRGSKSEIIWTIPFYLRQQLGHLDPSRIYRMSLEELKEIVDNMPRRPRYVHDAPKTIRDITRIVIEDCGGDAALIWEGRRARKVREIFMSVHGVGPGIANMAILLIEAAYDVRFPDLDRANMQIKPDVHTRRVLYRLGVAGSDSDQEALAAAKFLNPAYPGEIDAPLWKVGRTWCHASSPLCATCLMSNVCARVSL